MKHRMLWCAALAAATLTTPAFAQGQGGPGGGRGFGGFGGFGGGMFAGNLGFMLRIPEVQKELKLEQAQVDLLEGATRPAPPPGGFQSFQNMSQEERQKYFQTAQAEQEKKIAEVLDAKQMSRLKQLQLQQMGIRVLDRKDIADKLQLTPDQRQKVTAALQGERDGMRQMFQGGGFQRPEPGQAPSPEQIQQFQQMQQKMQKMRTDTDGKLNTVLTDTQKKQFETMKGAPFTFPPPRFGPGGFGRPGGGAGAGAGAGA